jgi:hypothetical protein
MSSKERRNHKQLSVHHDFEQGRKKPFRLRQICSLEPAIPKENAPEDPATVHAGSVAKVPSVRAASNFEKPYYKAPRNSQGLLLLLRM